MPLQSTSGAASYDAFGGGTVAKVNYIEDFFQSYLRTGTGASATVTTGLDGSTKETLVWTKSRSAATAHKLTDNVRGATKALSSNTTGAEATDSQGLTAFSATGYTLGTNTDYNNSGATYVDWQWVSQPKFFDIVTYTGTGVARTVAHNLGSEPGCMIVKVTDNAGGWLVYHRSLGATKNLVLNETYAATTSALEWNNTAPTSSVFTVGTIDTNETGRTYVAYLFAHDAGGFGLTGTDNVISCGSFTTDASGNATVSLGYEPQWTLQKRTDAAGNWFISDVMRGMTVSAAANLLRPNLSDAESTGGTITPTATGFTVSGYGNGLSIIYIAIRRGPMKVPTSSTSVFRPMVIPINSASATTPINAGLTTDMVFGSHNSDESGSKWFASRLTGEYRLNSTSTAAEAQGAYYWDNMVGVRQEETNAQPTWYFLKRAPSFFDEVCYTGTGSATTFSHNLGVVPELMIVKCRNVARSWAVYSSALGATKNLFLNSSNAEQTNSSYWNDAAPTASVFSVKDSGDTNFSTWTYVAYLFATCAGVSKVGSYTGTATTKQIDCGFTGGARFVLIKRTDSAADWYVWDSARGIVSGNDPYLLLNSTAAEVTSTDYIDTYSAGFEISSTAPAAINASGGSFVFLAIA